MTRLFALALIALPAAAAAGDYAAVPTAGADGRVITKTASWACTAAGCAARTEASRPLVVCQGLAKKVGALASFTADGRALGADELAKCNALAKGAAATTTQLAKN